MLKRFLLSFLTLTLLTFNSLLLPSAAQAQAPSPWYSTSFKEWYTKVYDTGTSPPSEIFGERYTAAQVQWVVYGLISMVLNIDGNTERMVCIMNGDINACISQFPLFSYVPQTNNNPSQPVLATLFPVNRSLSGVNYVREKLTKLHVIPEAKAQGFGFGALSPVREVWKIFRDITFGFFILVIIIMAFMIMFRVKISPQTVITVQSALPKIVVGLILVTFSYAIAGFLIDLMYVAIGLVAFIFSNTIGFTSDWGTLFKHLTDGPSIGGSAPLGAVGWLISYLILLIQGLTAATHGVTGFGALNLTVGFVMWTIGVIFLVGFMLWALVAAVKIFILLIKTYINIFLLVIFAPLQIGIGTLNPEIGFSRWLKSMVANLAVYPLVGTLFLIALMFLGASYTSIQDELSTRYGILIQSPFGCTSPPCQAWYPPLTVGTQMQGSSYDPLPILWLIASLGILAIIPKAGDLIQSLISKRPFAAGTAIGQAIGAGAAGLGVLAYPVRKPLEIFREAKRKDMEEAMKKIGFRQIMETFRRKP